MIETLVGRRFPKFVAPAVMPNNEIVDIDIESYFQGHIGVIIFYPLDFTFVCPSELIAFDEATQEFHRLGARVVAISIDSAHAHLQWRNMPRENGGIGQVHFPLISDIDHKIAQNYGVQAFGQSIALRATYIIDPETDNIVHQSVNDLSLGRNVHEILRIIAALVASRAGQVCPANWREGERLMDPTVRGVIEYLQSKKVG